MVEPIIKKHTKDKIDKKDQSLPPFPNEIKKELFLIMSRRAFEAGLVSNDVYQKVKADIEKL